jgi:hypothetical protein
MKLFYVILPLILLTSTTSIYGQKCKNFKDEIDPFTNKKIIISRGFSLSSLNIMNTKPDISGELIFENDWYLYGLIKFITGQNKDLSLEIKEIHENIISLLDVPKPEARTGYNDIYIVTDLMETDLHRVIYSKQVNAVKIY